MPKNEYKCQRCGEKFEYSKGLFERENNVKCPKCGAQNPEEGSCSRQTGFIYQSVRS